MNEGPLDVPGSVYRRAESHPATQRRMLAELGMVPFVVLCRLVAEGEASCSWLSYCTGFSESQTYAALKKFERHGWVRVSKNLNGYLLYKVTDLGFFAGQAASDVIRGTPLI